MADRRRPKMDYHEYKRRYEELRRERGGQVPVPEEQPVAPLSPEAEEQPRRGLLGGIRQAVGNFGGGAQEETPEAAEDGMETPEEAAADVAAAEEDKPEAEAVADPETEAIGETEEGPEEEFEEETEEEEIDNPFSSAAAKLKLIVEKLRRPKAEEEEPEEETKGEETEGNGERAAPERKDRRPRREKKEKKPLKIFGIRLPDVEGDEDDEDIAPSGGGIRPFSRRVVRDEKEILEDDEDLYEALEEPIAEDFAEPIEDPDEEGFGAPIEEPVDEDEEPVVEPIGEDFGELIAETDEEVEDVEEEHGDGTLTLELMKELDEAEESDEGRRARRRNKRGEEKSGAPETASLGLIELPEETEQAEEPLPVDEPTQVFKPLRRSRKADDQSTRRFKPVRASGLEEDDEEDEDTSVRIRGRKAKKGRKEDQGDDAPARTRGKKPMFAQGSDEDDDDDITTRVRGKKLRVYRDEDLEDDDYDDYEDGDDYDYVDYEYDPYDNEDEDEEGYEEERVGFGKRLLRFLRGLLLIALVLLVAILTLRQLEASEKLSLDLLRNSVGTILPLDKVFPKPEVPDTPKLPEEELPAGTEPSVGEELLRESQLPELPMATEPVEPDSEPKVPVGVAIEDPGIGDPENPVEAVG